jgi:hypothetical protein
MLYAKSCARAEELGIEGTQYEEVQHFAGAIRKAAMNHLGFTKAEELTLAAVTPMVHAINCAVAGEDGAVIPEVPF